MAGSDGTAGGGVYPKFIQYVARHEVSFVLTIETINLLRCENHLYQFSALNVTQTIYRGV